MSLNPLVERDRRAMRLASEGETLGGPMASLNFAKLDGGGGGVVYMIGRESG